MKQKNGTKSSQNAPPLSHIQCGHHRHRFRRTSLVLLHLTPECLSFA
uniref:Uncharacterized protein n=1 Tax=Anguilla anguilla TaxID=7936 RepID=A0A0E9VLE7_ANGAN